MPTPIQRVIQATKSLGALFGRKSEHSQALSPHAPAAAPGTPGDDSYVEDQSTIFNFHEAPILRVFVESRADVDALDYNEAFRTMITATTKQEYDALPDGLRAMGKITDKSWQDDSCGYQVASTPGLSGDHGYLMVVRLWGDLEKPYQIRLRKMDADGDYVQEDVILGEYKWIEQPLREIANHYTQNEVFYARLNEVDQDAAAVIRAERSGDNEALRAMLEAQTDTELLKELQIVCLARGQAVPKIDQGGPLQPEVRKSLVNIIEAWKIEQSLDESKVLEVIIADEKDIQKTVFNTRFRTLAMVTTPELWKCLSNEDRVMGEFFPDQAADAAGIVLACTPVSEPTSTFAIVGKRFHEDLEPYEVYTKQVDDSNNSLAGSEKFVSRHQTLAGAMSAAVTVYNELELALAQEANRTLRTDASRSAEPGLN
ncbi:hypothetical protein ACYPKM_00060 [Pseudomonas aeruginosa]